MNEYVTVPLTVIEHCTRAI